MSQRDGVVSYLLWGVANEPRIHYSQDAEQRLAALDKPRTLPLYTDCSGFVTLAYKDAGADDPNGGPFDEGLAWTGTLLANNEHIEVAATQPGDLIVYGDGGGDHVVGVIEPGADPLCVSHGQERGPIKVRHSVEVRAHKGQVRALRGRLDTASPTPIPPPPPEDDEVNWSYMVRESTDPAKKGQPGGPVAAVFGGGQVLGVKFFADHEEIFGLLDSKQKVYPHLASIKPVTDDNGSVRQVWVVGNKTADALGLPK